MSVLSGATQYWEQRKAREHARRVPFAHQKSIWTCAIHGMHNEAKQSTLLLSLLAFSPAIV